MQVRSFLLTMGAGIAVGALGAMMLPKNSEVYKTTKQAANASSSASAKMPAVILFFMLPSLQATADE